jgi:tRNA(fMet)-specific endonuclease VapC
MGVLIDASILIEHERGRIDVPTRVQSRQSDEFFLSVITASELLHGVHRARDAAVRARRAAFVEAILQTFPVTDIDVGVARTHARLWSDLASAGTPVGAHDLWLAATCVARGWTLVTANVREFARVPGLSVESW